MDRIKIVSPEGWQMTADFERLVERLGSKLAGNLWDLVEERGSHTTPNGMRYVRAEVC